VTVGDSLPGARGITIETLLGELRADWIDYLKIGIEGAELPFLYSQPEWLRGIGRLRIDVHASYSEEDYRADREAMDMQVRRLDVRGTGNPVLVASG
jgi:hypothetical protein